MKTDDRSDQELTRRLERIAEEIEAIVKETAPKLIRVSHLRKEADDLLSELRSRQNVVERRES